MPAPSMLPTTLDETFYAKEKQQMKYLLAIIPYTLVKRRRIVLKWIRVSQYHGTMHQVYELCTAKMNFVEVCHSRWFVRFTKSTSLASAQLTHTHAHRYDDSRAVTEPKQRNSSKLFFVTSGDFFIVSLFDDQQNPHAAINWLIIPHPVWKFRNERLAFLGIMGKQ